MDKFGQDADNESFNRLRPIESFYPDLGRNSVSNATEGEQDPQSSISTRVLYWYHPDYVGNVDLVTDLNGEAYEFYLYNPWGESLYHWESGSSSWNSPFRFNSKEFDVETGMHYYGARYHHPKMSIWMSVDPLAHITFDSYQYTNNNAIMYYDSDGGMPTIVFGVLGAVGGLAYGLISGASKEETIAYAVGGFVGGVTLGVGTAAIAGAGGAAVLSTSGSLMPKGAVAIVSAGLSNASTQATAMALGAQDEFDSQEFVLTLALSIPEAIAFGALSKALKGGLTKGQTARSMARQTHREKNIFMKQTIKKLREVNRGRFSNRQMREAAEKIYEMSLNSEQDFFKFQVYIHDGVIKIATTTVGNITTNEIIEFNKNEE